MSEKTYTTTDLMEITGLTRAGVLRRATVFGFTKSCKYVLKKTSWGNNLKEFLFTENQVKTMGCDHVLRIRKVEKEEVVEKPIEEKLEELKKEHPLVTDEKFLKFNVWPDVIPECFKEED